MKFLHIKYFFIFFLLINIDLARSDDQNNIKNLILNNSPVKYEKVEFKDISGKTINIEEFKGKVIVLNFWAIWCKPCRDEMKSLDLLKSNKSIRSLEIFPVNIGGDSGKKTKEFFKEIAIENLDLYFDPSLSLAKKFSLRGIPTTIIFDKDGKEFARIVGSTDFNDINFVEWIKKH